MSLSSLFRRAALSILAALLLPVVPLALPAAAATAPPSDDGWPRAVASGPLEFQVYQPQLDAFDGHRIDFHAAVSVVEPGSDAQTFGVLWGTGRARVDKDDRLVVIEELRIPRVSFPASEDGGEAYRAALSRVLPQKPRAIALDRVEEELAILAAGKKVEGLPLRNEPPLIVFSPRPAVLLFVDGEPVFRPVEKSRLRRLVNTRPLVLDDGAGSLWLRLFDGWLTSAALEGPWSVAATPPRELDEILARLAPTSIVDLLAGEPSDPDDPKSTPKLAKGPVPAVLLATSPTELVVTEGEPDYVPIPGTQLLYVENTTANVFKHLGDQQTYVLLAGRWFRAPSPKGPWEYVAGKALPKDFAAIPDASPKENVKASVPGTRQAREALVANDVPQTAKVDRKATKVEVVYDGEPQLKAIAGTTLQYVVNSAVPVLRVDARSWYAVDKGVWFVATGPRGPWAVAASVPAVIYAIPPSSPVHYVTYVRVYAATPQVVYVGYTPGYTGTLVSVDGVVVYGTGYVYPPWVGVVYYPPPPTYGYGVAIRYTPWTGWTVGFGFGWSYGAVTVGIGWGCYPAWGPYWYPPYWRPPYPYPYRGAAVGPWGAAAWGPGGWAATTGNVYSHYGPKSVVTRTSRGYDAWTGNKWANQVGKSYNSATGQLSAGQRSAVMNVYTGDYAAGRRGVTTNTRTGATAAGKQTISGNVDTGRYRAETAKGAYNPETGRYAAGEKTTVGNAKTGQSGTAGHGTVGNTETGRSVDYRYAKGSEGRGAGEVGDAKVVKTGEGDVYAGKDGNVYKKDENGWSKYDPPGATAGSSGTRGGWSRLGEGSSSAGELEERARARESGERRVRNYQSSPAGSSRERAAARKEKPKGGRRSQR